MGSGERLVARVALNLGLKVGNWMHVRTLSFVLKRKLTMDDKDTSVPRTVVSNVQEMNVVLSKCHDRVIIFRKIEVLDEIPPDRR